jgi:hypothetical protein
MTRLSLSEWRFHQARHRELLAALARARVERQHAHCQHPVDDFLFEYYSFRPAELLRWSSGVGVVLEGATHADVDWKECYRGCNGGLVLSADSFPEHRLGFLRWTVNYLENITTRQPSFGCFGLHEWAMVYRTPEIRHSSSPLRLSQSEIAAVVDSEGLRCTHFDAFRFFSPAAGPLNRVELSRQTTDRHDQKGCIHVTMDVYRYAYKLAPWGTAELIADAFLLAREARQIDMRASPYDLGAFGLEPIRIETRAGKDEYVAAQRELMEKAEPLRVRLIDEYRTLLALKSESAECVGQG